MKRSISLLIYLMSFTCFAQKSLVFENISIKDNMRLIGMYPHYDKERTFEKYNFIIEDIKNLDSITKIIVKGKEIMNQYSKNEFNIILFDEDKRLRVWSFNPKYSYIRMKGKSYKFDAKQILDLTKKYGFKYRFTKKTYPTKEHFEKDHEKLKTDPKLLFTHEPNFKFEGTFDVKFIKTRKFKHPKSISKYLRKKISQVKNDSEYRVYYAVNDYNRNNPNQYTMTVESDYELFEWFNDKSGEKKDWNKNVYSATFFLKD